MPIQVLSEQLASQIAAGEVVERPASVVKELVENAIDAGASHIQVTIREGGRKSIQISDDGSGIPGDQVETAFRRHATSKLTQVEDLNAIGTLGFRGEALAAISAVSQTTVVSRTLDGKSGVRLTIEGGDITGREGVGAPKGTVISVDNLFYNVPARLKFLKTVATERRQIDELVTNYALAYPHIRFRLTHDNRITLQTNGHGQLRDVLVSVYGADIAKELIELPSQERNHEDGSIAVNGYIAPPSLHRANRNQIILFVNGRWVKDRNLTYAVVQAYHTLLPSGRYPIAIVFIDLPLTAVDVNVHPTKTEVRFKEAGRIFGAVQKTVRGTLIEESPVRAIRAGQFEQLTRPSWQGGVGQAFQNRVSPPPQSSSWDQWGRFDEVIDPPGRSTGQGAFDLGWQPANVELGPSEPSEPAQAAPAEPSVAGDRLPMMRVVGQIGASYIVTEGPEGMFLIDQHAAHERVQFEKYMAAFERQAIASQRLVAGTAVQLPPDQATRLGEQIETLTRLGFEIEPFGPNAYMVRAVPAVVARQDPTRIIHDIVSDLETGDAPLQGKIEDKIIRRVCKTASIKAGQSLSRQEMEALIQQLEQCHSPHTCPHGRPTLIYLSVGQLEREFGRA